jgi:hypothetical protein
VPQEFQELITLWDAGRNQRSVIYPHLQRMQVLKLHFIAFSLVFASRDCNRLAHECARQVSSVVAEWQIECPLHI